MSRLLSIVVAAGALAIASPTLAQPTLSHATPMAVRPGSTTEITLHGAKLDGALRVWTSFPAQLETMTAAADHVKCKLTLDAAVAVGIGGIVVANAQGVSDPLLVVIDDLASLADNGTNHAPDQPQDIPLLAAVDGIGDGSAADYYRVKVDAGQRLSLEVISSRIGSTYDPVVRLLDADGRELLLVDDDEGLGAECRFAYTFPTAGQYLVELRDNKFAGGRYRLRVGDFPVLSVPYPLGVRRGATTRLHFAGPDAERAEPVIVRAVDLPRDARLNVGAKVAGGKSSALMQLATSEQPERLEVEPNDGAEQASQLTVPCVVNGRFQEEHDRDYYEFAAVKGQRLHFQARSRSLGSPTIVRMQLLGPDGGTLAESKASDSDEEFFSVTIPADGLYRLLAEDLIRRGGPEHAYRVEIRSGGTFSLALKNDKNTRNRFVWGETSGAVALEIECVRDGYDGPITLQPEQSAATVRLYNHVIPAKAKSVKLVIAVPPDLRAGDLQAIRLVGRATIDGQVVESIVSTAGYLRTKMAMVAHPPAWNDGWLAFATAAAGAPLFETTRDKAVVYLPRELGNTSFTLKLARQDKNFKGNLVVVPTNLPPGFQLAVKQDKDDYLITLTAPKNLPERRHELTLACFGDLNGRGQLSEMRIPLECVSPLAVSASPAGPLAVGQKQTVKIRVERKGDDRQPIMLRFPNLPAGITTTTEMMIPADQTEIEVELTASGDVAVGKFEQLRIEAVTKYAGQEIAVQSPPVTLEITKS